MIRISKSETADTRTCDFANVSKKTLLASSKQHISDVRRALDFFMARVCEAGQRHDPDKLTDIDGFHADFVTGFKQTGWLDRHRKLNRHHLTMADGIPADVNLIDVLDFIADCVMAGMARSGSVYPLHLPPDLLERAFQNTVELLKAQVTVEESVAEAPRVEPPRTGIDLIAAERARQIAVEGWTPAHDDDHADGELVAAAICYADAGSGFDLNVSPRDGDRPTLWPWEPSWWKPSDDLIRNLVKAGALIAAEIDRQRRDADLPSDKARVEPPPPPDDVDDDNDWRIVRAGRIAPLHGGHGSWVETNHPAVVACMGSDPDCAKNGCQAMKLKARVEPSPRAEADYKALYFELLYQVSKKYPGESRHETALRYLRQVERGSSDAACAVPVPAAGEEPNR